MLGIGNLRNGDVERTQANLDVAIYNDWKVGSRFKIFVRLISSCVGALVTFIILGAVSNDRGAQYFATVIFAVGAYILAQRLQDYFSNYHKCGEKLKLNDVDLVETDRTILQSTEDLNQLKESCKIAETLECVKCGVFCYIRTHDGH